MKKKVRAAGAVLLAAATVTLATAQSPPEGAAADAGTQPIAVTGARPADLVAPAARRLGAEFAREVPVVRVAAAGERQAAARRWLDEIFAPLAEPACAGVLAAAKIPAGAGPVSPAAFPADRPITGLDGVLLVPDELLPVAPAEAERFRTTGLLGFEIAATGEVARAAGARHAGPAPRDPLLRLSRAARLEGAARLSGLTVAAAGAGLQPADLGLSLLASDRDEAGMPREFFSSAATDPVRKALLRTYFDDGLRWALLHVLRGGQAAVLAGLERPGEGPETLVRPGTRRPAPSAAPAGCALGPRAATALLTGLDDAPWLGALLTDRWKTMPDGSIAVWLAFDDEPSATAAASDLASRGLRLGREKNIVRGALRRAPTQGVHASDNRPTAP